jgi:hypothetical protein
MHNEPSWAHHIGNLDCSRLRPLEHVRNLRSAPFTTARRRDGQRRSNSPQRGRAARLHLVDDRRDVGRELVGRLLVCLRAELGREGLLRAVELFPALLGRRERRLRA